MQSKFNKYCREVMGYKRSCPTNYNPYVDLNTMAEVVEKLLDDANIFIENQKYPNKYMITRDGFKQAFRDFIISTMPEGT